MIEFNINTFKFDKLEEIKIKYLYVLGLQQNKYYVGSTYDPYQRIRKHWFGDSGCSIFTSDYIPIRSYWIKALATTEPNLAEWFETMKVIELIDKYGFYNVQGGRIVGDDAEYRLKKYKRYAELIKRKGLKINYFKGIDDKDFNIPYNGFIR